MKKLYVTGYKPMELSIFNMNDNRILFIKEALKRRLLPLIEDGVEWVIISGQAGVELWAAEVVLDLKQDYDIQLAVIPPFMKQEERWKEEQQAIYYSIIESADFYQPLMNKEYESPAQFKLRDQWMLEKTDGSLVLYDEENEGTPKFFLSEVNRLGNSNYPVYYITAFDLDEVVRDIQLAQTDFMD